MVAGLNFLKVKFFYIFLFFIIATKSFSTNFNLEKIVDLNKPWGSSFINNDELIITEVGGKIKIVNIISRNIHEVDHNLNFIEYGQGGLLDIIFSSNNIWVSYSEKREGWKGPENEGIIASPRAPPTVSSLLRCALRLRR